MLKVWTTWLKDCLSEVRRDGPIEKEALEENLGLWRSEWEGEIRAAADRRETIPLSVVRSYARFVRPEGVARNLRAAANSVEIDRMVLRR